MSTLVLARDSLSVETIRTTRTAEGLDVDIALDSVNQQTARRLRENLRHLARSGAVIPVTWSSIGLWDGYYRVLDADVNIQPFGNSRMMEVSLQFLGTEDDVLFESRLTGKVLTNDFAITDVGAEPFHAPPPHTIYDNASALPGFITRTLSNGTGLIVYRDVSFTDDPKWGSLIADFYVGAASVKDRDNADQIIEGYSYQGTPTNLMIDNGLVRAWANGTNQQITVEYWDGTAWRSKALKMQVDGAEQPAFTFAAILDNRPERVSIRLEGGSGRVRRTLNLTLRRGARHIEGLYTTQVAGTLKVMMVTATAMTATNERIVANAGDAQGHLVMFASARSYTADTTNGGLSKAAVTTLDFMQGLQLSGAAAGDQAAQLSLQYLGYLGEEARLIRR